MPHDHHGHDCHHHHAPPDFGRAFKIGILLNTGFILAEIFYGLKADSLALLADAGHNVSDVLALAIAWGAAALGRRLPSSRFTYGLRSSSILASLANAAALLVVVGGIGWESLHRLFAEPVAAEGTVVMAVAALGVVINGATALLFMRGRKDDINIRAAYLHMLADAGISLGVVVAGALMLKTGWLWLDPLASLVISGLIIFAGWEILRESLGLALAGVPRGVDAQAVKGFLASLPGVGEVHDLHIWAMSTTEVAASLHLVMRGGHPGDAFLRDVAHRLEHDFKIHHATIQIEVGDAEGDCPLAPEHVV